MAVKKSSKIILTQEEVNAIGAKLTTSFILSNIFPIVGPLVTTLTFVFASRLQQLRVQKFAENIADEVAKMSESQIDKKYLKSEDFHDLIIQIIENVSKQRSKHKVDRLKKVVLHQIQEPVQTNHIENIVNLISSLDEMEIQILKMYRDFSDNILELYRKKYSSTDEYKKIEERHRERYGNTANGSEEFMNSLQTVGQARKEATSFNDQLYEKNKILTPLNVDLTDEQFEYYVMGLVGKGLILNRDILVHNSINHTKQIQVLSRYGNTLLDFLSNSSN